MDIDKSQYRPPQTEYSADIYKQIESATAPKTPEKIQAPFQFVKDIEVLVDSFRDTGEAIEQAKGREVKVIGLPIVINRPARKSEVIRKDFIDKERVIGGNLFAEKDKYYFWYGGKDKSAKAEPDTAGWYMEEIAPQKSTSNVVTHIETHPHHIKKFNHDGQRVPMTISDLEVFIPATYNYVREIMDIYPFDKDRAELLLDELEIPDDISALLPPEHVDGQKTDYGVAA
jgi:hypothetical protein